VSATCGTQTADGVRKGAQNARTPSGLAVIESPAMRTVTCLIVTFSLICASASSYAKTVAILVGCTYSAGETHFDRLEFGASDVDLISKVLPMDPADSTVVLPSESHAISKADILAAVKHSAPRCGPNDTFVFFFSGHGVPSKNGESMLVPEDSGPGDFQPDAKFLPVATLERAISESCSAKTKILILDACSSGGTLNIQDKTALDGHGFVVLAACGPDEVAYPLAKQPYSAFTYAVCSAVKDLGSYGGDLTRCPISQLTDEINHEMLEACQDAHIPPQHPVFRYDRDEKINGESMIQHSQPLPEVLQGINRPPVDPHFIARLKKGIGVMFTSDNADLSASAASAVRSELLKQHQNVFGPERSAELNEIINRASSLENQQYDDLTSRYLLRGKITYETEQETIDSVQLYKTTLSISISLLDLVGNILDEKNSDIDGAGVVVAASSPASSLQRAMHKALDRLDPILNKAIQESGS